MAPNSELTNEALLKKDKRNEKSHNIEEDKKRLLEITNDLKEMRKTISNLTDLNSIKKEIENNNIPEKLKEKIKQKSESENIEEVKEDLDDILSTYISKLSNLNTVFRCFKLPSDEVERDKHSRGPSKRKTPEADTAKPEKRSNLRKHNQEPFKHSVSGRLTRTKA